MYKYGWHQADLSFRAKSGHNLDMIHINDADDIGVRSQPVSPADQMIHNILRGSLATNWNGNGR